MRQFLGILACSVFLALGMAHGQQNSNGTASLDEIKTQHKMLTDDIQIKTRGVEKASKDLDAISSEIQNLKKTPQTSMSFLQKYKLQSRLQEAQVLSEKLATLKMQAVETDKKLIAVQQALIRTLDQEIDLQRKSVLSKSNPLSLRQDSATKLFQLLADRFSVVSSAYNGAKRSDSSLPQLSRDHEELQEQLFAMDDLEKKLSKEMEALRLELTVAQRQKFLQRELAQLFEEEAFFGEQGFVRVGSAKETTKKDPSTVALTSNGPTKTDEAAPTLPAIPLDVNQPHAAPNPVTMPVTDTSVATSPGGLPPATTSDGTSLSSTSRTALLRGQKEDPRSLIEASSLDRQIHWLDQQLSQTEAFLVEVRKTKKEIQHTLILPNP